MKTIIRKKVGAFLLSLTFLISLLPGGSVTAAAACAADSHTPGSELHAADWNNITGGYAYDYYLCTVCGAACDEDGYSAMLVGPGNGCSGGIGVGGKRHVIGDPYVTACAGTDTAQYYYCKACGHVVDADGTIVDLTALNGHTPGNTLYPADYAPCTGGCKTSYYRCTVCNLPCDANGDGSVYTPAGPMPHPHTPGSVLHAANWNRKDGGYIRSYYTCTVCDTPCDAKGHAASYAGPSENCPMGLHTPGSEKHEPDYTPCSGGIKEEWYECDVCGAPCDAKGNTLEVLPPIGHTPGSEKHEPNYSPCSGGIKEDWYECEACGQPCDADGNSIEIHAPTGSHTPGSEKHEPNYTPCSGGIKEDWYECETCHQPCDAEGNPVEGFEPTGSHTPGSEKHEPDYTPCNGGFKDEWYECETCHQPCDADGNPVEGFEPTGSHTPGSEKHEPDYTPCGGGIKEEWYECDVCGQPCDADGNSIEIHEPTGSHHLVEVPAKDPTYEEDGNSAYWVCSDCQALFKDAEGATPIEDESEIVIPKLDKPNEKPDETPEKPASGTLETVVSDGLAKVPSSVVSQYPTTDNVYEAMIAAALKADPAMDTEKAGSVLLDVTLRIKNANGTITRVTARNFPSEGVEVLLPYPEGTDETFTFVVAHMITTGSRAGEIEILPNTSEKGGIRVRFMSLSPVTITYRAGNTPAPGTEDASKPAPSDPADPDDSASIDKAPQTGVNNPLFWSFAALLCGGIVLACLAENKKRNR